ncbi:ParA family protein [Marinococcus halotolerans]|uniref:ParA family protein n=1 Tax=Marinococcus halotolerans TaxID=301092 RepID=UPI0003B769F1|nr:ParA family protein [Marinococcus halotolerans]
MLLAVSTNKGGVLKTSIATSLASIYSQEQKTLIIDADNQGNVALTYGRNPDQYEYTIYDVLAQNVSPEAAIDKINSNLHILPANDELAFLEFDVLSNPNDYPKPFHIMREKLTPLLASYDVIIMDAPPNIGLITGNILSFVQDIIIPFQPEHYSMRSFIKMLEVIDNFKGSHNKNLKVSGVVGTLVDSRTVLHKQILEQCEEYCEKNNIRMFKQIIPRSVQFANSIAYEQQPAVMNRKKNPATEVYFNIKEELDNGKK